MKIYLAGGMRTNWQQNIINEVKNHTFWNPMENTTNDSRIFSIVDKVGVESCVVIFAYLERTNPCPCGLIAELCYGKGLGKITVFVNEWTEDNYKANNWKSYYMDLISEWVDVKLDKLEDGTTCLKNLR